MPSWHHHLTRDPLGFYVLDPSVTDGVPVRLFLTEALLEAGEEGLYQQILNACALPGVRAVAITPDVHFGYGVPVGCVIATDGTLAMGPVGFDIGCGMMAARSTVDAILHDVARGSLANWHPHLRLVVTDGGFRPDGTFVRRPGWPDYDSAALSEVFRRAVLRLFVRRG